MQEVKVIWSLFIESTLNHSHHSYEVIKDHLEHFWLSHCGSLTANVHEQLVLVIGRLLKDNRKLKLPESDDTWLDEH